MKLLRDTFRDALVPLLFYTGIAAGVPLLSGGHPADEPFWEHELCVLVVPLVVIVLWAGLRALGSTWIGSRASRR